MKQFLFASLVLLLSIGSLYGQNTSYRVVFDLTSRDSLDQKAVMRWVKEITSSNPKAQLEVVMYGKGFELVMPEKSSMLSDVKEAMKNPNVSFKVCEVALMNNKADKSQLFAGVKLVPDGIYEIISRQKEGWGYIKVTH